MSKKSLMGSSASLPDTTSWSEPKETVLHLGDNVLGVIKPGPPTGPMDTGISTACIDCRTETQPNKAAGNYEQFIVTDEVWQAAGMPLGNVDPKSFVLKGGGAACALGASIAGSGAGSRTPISSGRRGYGRTATLVGSRLGLLNGSLPGWQTRDQSPR